MTRIVEKVHGSYVHGRRVRVLAEWLRDMIPLGSTVLDVGCGDGRLAALVADGRPDLSVRGIDVLVRPGAVIPVDSFDGVTLPFPDGSFDVVMFVDVLHHTADPNVLLTEAARVARRHVVIKDHLREGLLAERTLRFMDHVGNARHGVALPYNYWRLRQWDEAFARLGLEKSAWHTRLGLYPWPANLLFGRGLHFAGRLDKKEPAHGG